MKKKETEIRVKLLFINISISKQFVSKQNNLKSSEVSLLWKTEKSKSLDVYCCVFELSSFENWTSNTWSFLHLLQWNFKYSSCLSFDVFRCFSTWLSVDLETCSVWSLACISNLQLLLNFSGHTSPIEANLLPEIVKTNFLIYN